MKQQHNNTAHWFTFLNNNTLYVNITNSVTIATQAYQHFGSACDFKDSCLFMFCFWVDLNLKWDKWFCWFSILFWMSVSFAWKGDDEQYCFMEKLFPLVLSLSVADVFCYHVCFSITMQIFFFFSTFNFVDFT